MRKLFGGRPPAEDIFSWFDPLVASPRVGAERLTEAVRSWRFLPLYLFPLFVFFVFLARLFDLQIIQGRRNFLLSEGNRLRIETIFPERGVILSREGELLARNRPGFMVVLRKDVALSGPLIFKFAEALSLGEDDVAARVKDPANELAEGIILKRGLSQDEVFKVETSELLSSLAFIRVEPQRDYLYPETFAHVLGYVGEVSLKELRGKEGAVLGEKVGKEGLEAGYDAYLKGRVGKRLLETEARGRVLREEARIESQPGLTLKTNLSLLLQKAAFGFLREAVEKSDGSGGAAVGQNPATGEILFFVSYPSFDANELSQGISASAYQRLLDDSGKPLFNRALMAVYPPGSVFKLVTGAAALAEGVVDAKTVIYDRGFISVGSFVYRGWKEGGHGALTFADALSKSCDIYFYTVGGGYGDQPGVGVSKLAAWARTFGLGERSGVDLPGEALGLVPDEEWKKKTKNEPWYIGNTYHLAIGQGDLAATPLQINTLMAAVVNGGRVMKPFVAREISRSEGEVVLSLSPQVIRENFINLQRLDLIKEGLRRAVLPGGTGYPMQGFRLSSGGKTGTAEYEREGKTHAWFVAFAPFEEPEIVVTVLVEGGGEGSSVAAPVVRKILDVWADGRGGR